MSIPLVVRPIDRARARRMCEDHPHAATLPNSSKYYMLATIRGRPAGLAVWGYGVRPADTPNKLFSGGVLGVRQYLELCRFFVYDWCPPNTASKFLTTTHRLIKTHIPRVEVLYTYAAGFQGLVGYIYQASGYEYIGEQVTTGFLWVKGVGLVHRISLHNRYGRGSSNPKHWQEIFPGSVQFGGINFCYIYWLCGKRRRRQLRKHAKFETLPYPKDKNLRVWTKDVHGNVDDVDITLAKSLPIVKLRTKRSP